MKIGVIGGGAMGSAVSAGLVKSGFAAAEDIMVSTPHPEKISWLSEMGVRVMNDNRHVASRADILILAVKPWILPGVVNEIAEVIDPERQAVDAIVAGVKGEELENWFGNRVPECLSISMPNTAMSVMESMTFIVNVRGRNKIAEDIYSSLGKIRAVTEDKLGAGMALASCGIAFAMRYVRAACEGGVELGFKASEAQQLIAQTLKGAVRLLEIPGSHPETEIDKVTTPGGITIRGLNAMERAGFSNSVIAGLLATGR